jgi:protein ImuB
MLWTCLLFPSLPLDVFTRAQSPQEQAQPFAVASGGHYPRVVTPNAAARAAGVTNGQLVSAALALAPSLALRDRDPAAEDHALAQLATWALTFTPNACIAPPNAVVAEIDGSLRLFGGLPRLVSRLVGGTHALGYPARLGIAPTPGAALLLARHGHPRPVIDTRHLAAVLADIPLIHVDMGDAIRTTLHEAGITTFGQAAALPRDGLARRCGADFVAAIDRTLGRASDPRPPFVPAPRFESKLDLPAPVHDVEALGFGVQRLVHELSHWLTSRGLGVVRLTLILAHERYVRQRGTPATVVPFALGAPARTAAHLLGVLRERLARVELPASVETITLVSAETMALGGRNLGLLPGDEADAVEVPLLDRLRARLGEDAVMRLVPHPEHRPELAMREAATAATPAHAGTKRSRKTTHASTSAPLAARRRSPRHGGIAAVTDVPADAATSIADAPRPVWLLAEPQPLAHLSERHPLALRDGPERIESGWWDGTDVRRDYFTASTPAQEIVWIYRDHRYGTEDGEWFLHGYFA